jgi:hypothetical protein
MAKKKFWTTEKIVSLAAISISLMTLIVIIWQTNLLRQQQHLSVLPYLSFGNERTYSPNYQYTLTNNGIGPALIRSIRITNGDEVFQMDIPNFLQERVPAFDSLSNITYSNIYPGRFMPAGEKIIILGVENSLEDANGLLQILGELQKEGFDFELEYCSIYDRCWRIKTSGTAPEPL